MRKKDLEVLLSRLQSFAQPKVKLEQYQTPSSIAADLLWDAYQKGHIKGKTIADLGCGTGILGLGALVLGAKKVFFVDIDADALILAKENLKLLEKNLDMKLFASFTCVPLSSFSKKVDVVFQNPPFGTKDIHADKAFLEKALSLSALVYSFHKFSTKKFVEDFAEQKHFHLVEMYRYKFSVKAQFDFHISRVKYIDVGCWCFEKN
ncbi:MAG: METTL5 family protein [bacterium]|nr:METTL5 family protein [bacterium]